MDTIWLTVKDKAIQGSVIVFLKEILPDLQIEPAENGPVLWVKVSGNSRVRDLRSFLKNAHLA